MSRKIILCYGDSNTWGWVANKMGAERYDEHTRWPGVLRDELGDEYSVLEDALGARTTNLDEPRPELPLRNGLQMLPITLETNGPVDIVIFMIGTPDLKPLFDVSPEHITQGMRQNIEIAQNFKPINGKKPARIIVIAPPIIDDAAPFASKAYTGATPKSKALIPLYRQLASDMGCEFLDSNKYVQIDPTEGVHITKESHQKLGLAVAELIKSSNKT